MKFKIILISALLLAAGSVHAQEEISQHYCLRLGVGLPGAATEYFTNGVTQTNFGMEAIYGDYLGDLTATPAISVEAYYIYNQWFRFGLDFVYGSFSDQVYSGITDKVRAERHGQCFILLPSASFSYFQKGAMYLYMGLGVGLGYYAGFDNMQDKFSLNLQFTPIGVEYGRKVFCFAEAGLGTAFSWVRGGIGYRF
ncbi:MAG: hypothetical protein IKX45_02255 [Bacteroidales bacterium]|nr:hypothetical protein [Bacteroidales bacterium]